MSISNGRLCYGSFQLRLESAVHDYVHGPSERHGEINVYAKGALLYQVEARPVARVTGQVETDEGVAM